MNSLIKTSLLLFSCAFNSASAESWVVSVDGMGCVTCQPKIEAAFSTLNGIQSVRASTVDGEACVSTESGVKPTASMFQKSLENQEEYTVTGVKPTQTCDITDAAKTSVKMWSEVEGIDAQVISHREEVNLQESTVPGKFTIIDFGADWCGPCVVAEKVLRSYLVEHGDTAVRAVAMVGASPAETFALPVANQHLKNAAGLPLFIVYDTTGHQIYKGANVNKALEIVNKKRDR